MSAIKPLEWVWVERTSLWAAKSAVGEYFAWFIEPNGVFLAPGKSHGTLRGASIEETKAAAQSDHDERIVSALDPAYLDRVKQLEEALREAERFLEYYAGETNGTFVGLGTPQKWLASTRALLNGGSNERA